MFTHDFIIIFDKISDLGYTEIVNVDYLEHLIQKNQFNFLKNSVLGKTIQINRKQRDIQLITYERTRNRQREVHIYQIFAKYLRWKIVKNEFANICW